MSKFHGPKIHKVECAGVIISEDGKPDKVIYDDDHNKFRMCHASDVHQVERCVPCQKLNTKLNKKRSTSPVKKWKKMMEYRDTALATIAQLGDDIDEIDVQDKMELEETVDLGNQAEAALTQYEIDKKRNARG